MAPAEDDDAMVSTERRCTGPGDAALRILVTDGTAPSQMAGRCKAERAA